MIKHSLVEALKCAAPLATIALLAGSSGCRPPVAVVAPAGATATTSAAPLKVVAAAPTRQSIEAFTMQPARIQAFEEAPLFARVAGYVAELPVDIGDRVARGDVVARLSAPELLAEVRQQEAMLVQAEAEVKQAAAAVRAKQAKKTSAQSQVASVEAGVQRAAGEHARWQAEYTRVSELAASRSVTQKLADETKSQLDAAQAARDEAEAQVASSRALVEQAQAEVDQSAADAEVVAARLEVARVNLSYAQTMAGYLEIVAPFAGVVIRRNVDTGHFVEPGDKSPPLFAIASTDRLRVFVDVPENQAALAEKGDPATIAVQGLNGREFAGTVTRTSWALDEANRSLRVEIGLDNENGLLRPGMYASAKIRLDARTDALTLPTTAVFQEAGRAMCCVAKDGRIARTPIETGLRGGDRVEITSGLSGDQIVVMANSASLVDGQPVEVTPPEPPKP